MNVDLAQELLNELGSSLEKLETQCAALLQCLKDNGTLTDDQFAPYLAEAGKSSDVRWRAAHIRLESLFRSERQKEEELMKKLEAAGGAAPSASQSQNGEDGARNVDAGATGTGASRNDNQAGTGADEKPGLAAETADATSHKEKSEP